MFQIVEVLHNKYSTATNSINLSNCVQTLYNYVKIPCQYLATHYMYTVSMMYHEINTPELWLRIGVLHSETRSSWVCEVLHLSDCGEIHVHIHTMY